MPGNRASASQSSADSAFSGSSWAVTKATADATSRCVTGMPAYAGAATPAVTPGTTSKRTPAAASASASSPPRPNTNGSPPFRRTTSLPLPPSSTRRALMSSWGSAASPGCLPT